MELDKACLAEAAGLPELVVYGNHIERAESHNRHRCVRPVPGDYVELRRHEQEKDICITNGNQEEGYAQEEE